MSRYLPDNDDTNGRPDVATVLAYARTTGTKAYLHMDDGEPDISIPKRVIIEMMTRGEGEWDSGCEIDERRKRITLVILGGY